MNTAARESPEHNQDYCDKCGAQTIVSCPECDKEIQGKYHPGPGVISVGRSYTRPAFCQYCAKPFPWTVAILGAAEELADELDDLSHEDKELLKKSLPDLLYDTPRTGLAQFRFKNLMVKASKEGARAMWEILKASVTESVRAFLTGS